jgi:rhamnosyltransferase
VINPRPARILVLMAARNGANWIGEQIDSILSQQDVDVVVVVSDDCSTDDTRKEVERFESTGRITLHGTGSPTGSAARNFLSLIEVQSADGFDYVAFADQDDVWHPEKLKRACQCLRSAAFAGYSSAVTATWDDGRRRTLRQSAAITDSDFLFEGAGQGCTFVLDGAFYTRVREFLIAHRDLAREAHYHDWTIYALARVWGQRWFFDSKPTLRYRQHDGNDTGARTSLAGVKKRVALIAASWYAAQITTITRLCLAANPVEPATVSWHRISSERVTWRRRLRVAGFCLKGGRRKAGDNAILTFAALAGWI